MHAQDNHIEYKLLKEKLKRFCTHSLTVEALKAYPLGTLPLKQRLFAYGIKYRLYFFLKILVRLRRG